MNLNLSLYIVIEIILLFKSFALFSENKMKNLWSRAFNNSRNAKYRRFKGGNIHLVIFNTLFTVSNNVESMGFLETILNRLVVNY